MVARDMLLAQVTGAQFHVAHISSRNAIAMVAARTARSAGDVRDDAAPLHVVRWDIAPYDSNFKMKPPLRGSCDLDAVIDGVVSGVIDVIATDHAPHPGSEKMQEFERVPLGSSGPGDGDRAGAGGPGASGADPAGEDGRAVHDGAGVGDAAGAGDARAGGAGGRDGVLDGGPVDVRREPSASRSRNSPFHGKTFRGGPVATVVNGQMVWKR